MFSRVRIAIRFFFVGLVVGVLLAPRSGEETRRMVRERADRLLNDLLEAATLGSVNTGSTTSTDAGTADGPVAAETPTSGRGNGRGRSRSSSAAETAAEA
ncbi:MAG TPA: YtxH domain-containing protein [Candidatus Limnocylindria bacterium]|nr:YtxH domain-containing protein [Candidatus Limnocylindria bacterium]